MQNVPQLLPAASEYLVKSVAKKTQTQTLGYQFCSTDLKFAIFIAEKLLSYPVEGVFVLLQEDAQPSPALQDTGAGGQLLSARSGFLPFESWLMRKTPCVSLRETERWGNTTTTTTTASSVLSKMRREKKTHQLHLGGKHWQLGFTVLLYPSPPPQERRCVQQKGNGHADRTSRRRVRMWQELASTSVWHHSICICSFSF